MRYLHTLTRTFEVRDRMTFIVAIAVRIWWSDHEGQNRQGGAVYDARDAAQRLLWRAGYGPSGGPYTQLIKATGGGMHTQCDPYGWNDRTMTAAHAYIHDHWDDLTDGQVVDVEHILGERLAPVESEVGGG